MSQPAFSALAPLPFDLVYDDGEPLESGWHVAEQGRSDFYGSWRGTGWWARRTGR